MTVTVRAPAISHSVFGACSYFLPRLMFLRARYAPQVHWGDVVLALRDFPDDNVDLSSAAFWDEWGDRWVARAEEYVGAAAASSTAAGRAQAMRSAAACYHWAEFMQFEDAEHKLGLRRRVRECFCASWAGELTVTSGTVRSAGAGRDDHTVPYWLIMPPGDERDREPVPCVVLSNGLDSMTEVEILSLAEAYLERGMAAVLFEGPGQGLSVGQVPLRLDMEVVVQQIARSVSEDARIDGERLGFVGVSFGGYFALRVAQGAADLFRCVANLSGGPWLAPFDGLPRRLKADFSFAFMHDAPTSVQAVFDDLALDLSLPATTNVLSIHGARDDIFPLAGLRSLDEAWNDKHELVVFEDEAHVCLNEINLVSLTAADWMAQWLQR